MFGGLLVRVCETYQFWFAKRFRKNGNAYGQSVHESHRVVHSLINIQVHHGDSRFTRLDFKTDQLTDGTDEWNNLGENKGI